VIKVGDRKRVKTPVQDHFSRWHSLRSSSIIFFLAKQRSRLFLFFPYTLIFLSAVSQFDMLGCSSSQTGMKSNDDPLDATAELHDSSQVDLSFSDKTQDRFDMLPEVGDGSLFILDIGIEPDECYNISLRTDNYPQILTSNLESEEMFSTAVADLLYLIGGQGGYKIENVPVTNTLNIVHVREELGPRYRLPCDHASSPRVCVEEYILPRWHMLFWNRSEAGIHYIATETFGSPSMQFYQLRYLQNFCDVSLVSYTSNDGSLSITIVKIDNEYFLEGARSAILPIPTLLSTQRISVDDALDIMDGTVLSAICDAEIQIQFHRSDSNWRYTLENSPALLATYEDNSITIRTVAVFHISGPMDWIAYIDLGNQSIVAIVQSMC